jgi:hypothetical protein
MFFRGALQRFTHGDHFAGGFTAGNGPGVRRAHHHAFQHGLAANQGFLPALKGGKKLDSDEETNEISQ